jgi:hypothetical protein
MEVIDDIEAPDVSPPETQPMVPILQKKKKG